MHKLASGTWAGSTYTQWYSIFLQSWYIRLWYLFSDAFHFKLDNKTWRKCRKIDSEILQIELVFTTSVDDVKEIDKKIAVFAWSRRNLRRHDLSPIYVGRLRTLRFSVIIPKANLRHSHPRFSLERFPFIDEAVICAHRVDTLIQKSNIKIFSCSTAHGAVVDSANRKTFEWQICGSLLICADNARF